VTEELRRRPAELADAAARNRPVDPAARARIVEAYDDEVHISLVETFFGLLAADPEAAWRYAGELERIAARLAEPHRSDLAVVVDLVLGKRAAEAEEWAEAEERLLRARDRLGPERLPEQIGDCEIVLAHIVHRAGRTIEGRQRAWAARAIFVDDGDWAAAAAATEFLAWATDHDVRDRARATSLWRDAADLAAAGGDREEARRLAECGGGQVLDRIDALGDPGDSTAAVTLAAAARGFAVRHGAADSAVQLAERLIVYGADLGWAWPQVRRWADIARAEYRALPGPPESLELRLARIDALEGAAATGRGLVVAAEAPLRRAIAVARRHGKHEFEEGCVRLLSGVRSFTAVADLERLARGIAVQNWTIQDSAAGALTIQAVAAWRAGGDSAALVDRARASLSAESDDKRLLLDLLVAYRGLEERGDVEAARRCLVEVDAWLADHRGSIARGVAAAAGLLRVGIAARTPGADALPEIQRVEDMLHDSGLSLFAAQMAAARAQAHLDAGRHRQALDAVLPAALALDALRFSLDEAGRRRRWNDVAARALAIAFRAAAGCGEHALIAELLETARGNGVPLPRDASTADPMADLLDAAAAPSVTPGVALSGAHTTTAAPAAGRTALGLPARLRPPWPTSTLAEPLERARRYHDPVRAQASVAWRIGP
jgi:hypothetical protein